MRSRGRRSLLIPDCYPTAALLALLPLATVGEAIEIVIDAKSGITGAGRNPKTGSLFAEVSGDDSRIWPCTAIAICRRSKRGCASPGSPRR